MVVPARRDDPSLWTAEPLAGICNTRDFHYTSEAESDLSGTRRLSTLCAEGTHYNSSAAAGAGAYTASLPSGVSVFPRASGATRCTSAPASPSRYQGRQSVVIGPWASRVVPQHARTAVASAAAAVASPASPGRRSSASAPTGTNPFLLHPVLLGPQMPSPQLPFGQGSPITYTPPVIHVRPTAGMMGAPLNIPLQDILSHIQLVAHLPTTPVSTLSSPQ